MESNSSFLERCADSLQGLDVLKIVFSYRLKLSPVASLGSSAVAFWVLSIGALFAATAFGSKNTGDLDRNHWKPINQQLEKAVPKGKGRSLLTTQIISYLVLDD